MDHSNPTHQVTASIVGSDRKVTVGLNFGTNLDEAVELFGPDKVYDFFLQQAKVASRVPMKNMIKADKSDEEIIERMKGWEPGQKVAGGGVASPLKAIEKKAANMSEEEKRALLKEIQAKLGLTTKK